MESNSKFSPTRTRMVSVEGVGDNGLVVVGGSVVTCGSVVMGGVGVVE